MTQDNDLNKFVQRMRYLQENSTPKAQLSKYTKVFEASQAKQEGLRMLMEQSQKEKEIYDKTMAGSFGFDQGSFMGETINTGAAALDSGFRLIGNALTALDNRDSAVDALSFSDADKQIFAKIQEGTATPEEINQVTSYPSFMIAPESEMSKDPLERRNTAWDRYKNYQNTRKKVQAVNEFFDTSHIVDQSNIQDAAETARKGFREAMDNLDKGNYVQGALGFPKAVLDTAVDNPLGALQVAANSAADVVAGVATGGASVPLTSGSYALGELGKGLDQRTKDNDGMLPGAVDTIKMTGVAGAMAAAEALGDASIVKGITKSLSKEAGKIATKKALTEAAEKTFLNTMKNLGSKTIGIAGKVPGVTFTKNVGTVALKGGAAEFPTEYAQTAGERYLQGEEFSPEENFVGGTLGALGGGVFRGAPEAVASALDVVAPRNGTNETTTSPAQSEAIKKAKAERNADFFLDPKTEFYDPVEGASVYLDTVQDETASPESKEEAKTQAATLLDTLESSLASTEEIISNPPAKRIETLTADNEAKNTELNQLMDIIANTSDPAELSQLQQQQADLETAISRNTRRIELFSQMGDEILSKAQKTVKGLRTNRDKVKTILDRIDAETAPQTISDEDIKSSVATLASSADTPQVSPSTLLTRLMAVPDSITPEDLEAIVNNTTNSLTEQERAIAKQFAESRRAYLATKDILDVNKDIRTGNIGDGFYGVEDHRTNIVNAVQNSRPKSVDYHFNQLSKLADTHQQKLNTFLEAREQYRANPSANPRGVTVYKEPNGEWTIGKPPAPSKSTVLEISNNSNRLINTISAENDYIKSTLRDMDNLISLSSGTVDSNINTPITPNTTDTTNTPITPTNDSTTNSESNINTPTNTPTSNSNNINSPSFVSDVGTNSSTAEPTPVKTEAKPEKKVEQKESAKPVEAKAESKPVEAFKPKTEVSTPPTPEKPSVEPENEVLGDSETTTKVEKPVDPEVTDEAPEGDKPAKTTLFSAAKGKLKGLLVQATGNEQTGSTRPLASVPQFLNTVSKAFSKPDRMNRVKEVVEPYLDASTLENLESNQDLVESFLKFYKDHRQDLMDVLPRNFTATNAAKLNETIFAESPLMGLFVYRGKDAEGNTVPVQFGPPTAEAQLEDNVVAAAMYSAYTWLAEGYSDLIALNDKDKINGILGQPEYNYVSPGLFDLLTGAGTLRSHIQRELGSRAVKALGLRETKNTPKDMIPKMTEELGGYVLKMLMNQGFLYEHRIPTDDIRAEGVLLAEGPKDIPMVNGYAEFDSDSPVGKELASIRKSYKETKGFLHNLFGVTSDPVAPTTSPQEFKQAKAKDSTANVPEFLKEHLNNVSQEKWYVASSHQNLMLNLGTEFYLKLNGWVEPTIVDGEETFPDIPANLRASQAAKNAAAVRELEDLQRFIEEEDVYRDDGYAAPFFMLPTVWKNFRVGLSNNQINPVSSKFIRQTIYNEGWESVVDVNNPDQVETFLYGIASAFGLSTDKAKKADTLSDLNELMNTDLYKQALRAVQDGLYEEGLMDGDADALAQFINQQKEGLHVLSGLVALVEFERAKTDEDSDGKFTAINFVEVDGVSNGPILYHLLHGIFTGNLSSLKEFLHEGGIFEKGSPYENYNDYRSKPGNKDHYERFVETFIVNTKQYFSGALSGDLTEGREKEVRDFMTILGILDPKVSAEDGTFNVENLTLNRNFGKGPVSPLVFGSSVGNVVRTMADKFFEDLLNKLQNIDSQNKDALHNWKYSVVSLLNMRGNYADNFMNKSKQELLDYEFSNKEIKAINQAYTRSIGGVLRSTIASHYAPLLENRDIQNKASNLAFMIYDETYRAMKKEKLDSKKLPKTFPKKGEKAEVVQDITVAEDNAIIKELAKEFPVLHSAYSIEQGSKAVGIPMASEGVVKVREPNYKSLTRLRSNNSKGYQDWASYAYAMQRNAPGPLISSVSTHSFDSWIAHKAEAMLLAKGIKTLNIHDAKAVSPEHAIEVAKAFNQATLEGLIMYSPAIEANSTLQSSIHNLAKRLLNPSEVTNNLLEGILRKGYEYRKDGGNGETFIPAWGAIVKSAVDTKQAAYRNTYNKLMTLLETGVIDQYAYEGGSYKLTPEDYKAIENKLKELQKSFGFGPKKGTKKNDKSWIFKDNSVDVSLSEVENLALEKITESLQKRDTELDNLSLKIYRELKKKGNKSDFRTPTDDMPSTVVERESPSEPVKPSKAVRNIIPQDGPLQNFLKSGNTPKSIREVLRFLWRQDKNNTSGYRPLIQAIGAFKSLDKVSVELVSENTDPTTILNGMPEKKAFGWMASDGTTTKIYLTDSSLAHGGINAEVIIHEALHAAVNSYIDSNPESNEVLALEELRQEVESFLNQAGNETLLHTFAGAVSDVHELVSWGMTNRDFQNKVLKQVQHTVPETGKSVIQQLKTMVVNGLNTLYSQIANIIGLPKGKESGVNNLLGNYVEVLINNALNQSEKLINSPTTRLMESTNTLTSEAILEAINTNQGSPEFNEHLKSVLNNISAKVFGPVGIFRDMAQTNMAITPEELYTKSVEEGVLPFTSSAIQSGMKLRPEEALVVEEVEATLRTVFQGNEANVSHAKRELEKLYHEARNSITPKDLYLGDWSKATPDEKAEAQNEWDFIFKLSPDVEGKMDYLSRFASLGLGSEKLNSLLKTPSKVAPKETPKTIGERLKAVFNTVLDWLNNKAMGTFQGMPMDAKLNTLVERLVRIEQTRAARLKPSLLTEVSDKLDDFSSSVSDKVSASLSKALDSQSAKQMNFPPAQRAREALKAMVDGKLTEYVNARKEMRFKYLKSTQEFAASVVDYMQGPKEAFKTALEFAKGLQGTRQDILVTTRKAVRNAFENGGKDLTEDQSVALSNTLLRTGAHALMTIGNKSVSDILDLVDDAAKRNAEIAKLESSLSFVSAKDKNFYLTSAKDLAYHRQFGGLGHNAHLLMNARNIAGFVGLDQSQQVSAEQVNQATPILEQLIALYGLEYATGLDRQNTVEVMAKELGRADKGNGIEFILKLHAAHQQEAKETLFKDQEVLMTHGYTMDNYDQNIDFRLATLEEGKELELMGYTRSQEPVPQDNQVINTKEPLYAYSMDIGRPSVYTSGITSMTGMHAKGTDMYSQSLTSPSAAIKARDLRAIKQAKQASIDRMFNQNGVTYDPRKSKAQFAIPVLNPQGGIASYRYEAARKTRDDILHRENRVEELLALEASHSFDKENTLEHNRNVVKLLHQEYLDGFTKEPNAYVKVSPRSTDPKMRELYHMLPEDMKMELRKVWKSDDFLIRRDLMLVTFGNRMPSLVDAFNNPQNKSFINKMLVMFVEGTMEEFGKRKYKMTPEEAKIYAKKAPVVLRKIENGSMDIVKEIKDLIVIKAVTTLVGNITSNIMLLWMNGVSIPDIYRNHVTAFKGIKQYQIDTEDLMELMIHQKANTTPVGMSKGELEDRIKVLNNRIESNPVTPMMRAGMMTSIVEDISENIDPNSYTAKAKGWVQDKTDKVSPLLTETINVLTLGKDTALYQFLSDFTKYSDFMARYTLMQSKMNSKKDPKTFDDAKREAMDMFINYDIPLPPALQYTDAMGLTLFTKYFLSIQQVIYNTLRSNTAKTLRVLTLNDYLFEFATIMDSAFYNRFLTNPINSGPFKLLEVLDELPTISVPYQLIR